MCRRDRRRNAIWIHLHRSFRVASHENATPSFNQQSLPLILCWEISLLFSCSQIGLKDKFNRMFLSAYPTMKTK